MYEKLLSKRPSPGAEMERGFMAKEFKIGTDSTVLLSGIFCSHIGLFSTNTRCKV